MAGPIFVVRIFFLIALLNFSTITSASSEKVVYHLHSNSLTLFIITVNNLENLFHGLNDDIEIRLLLQGESINLLNPASISENLALRLDNLIQKGVMIETSRKNYQENEFFLDHKNIPILIDNVFSRVIELQRMGYRYITP